MPDRQISRLHPALDLTAPVSPDSSVRDLVLALLEDFELAGVEERDAAWRAYFPTSDARDRAAAAVRDTLASLGIAAAAVDVPDEDWARRTQADLKAVRVGRIVIAPPWDLPEFRARSPAAPQLIVIQIEPSTGFGTGHHASTRVCLALMQQLDLRGRTVLDVGTGSGVLAIAANRLGASEVTGLDVDPDAIESARINAGRNGLAVGLALRVADIRTAGAAPADLVVANLTGACLQQHADAIGRTVRPSGHLVAAGFTIDEEDGVRAAFSHGFEVARREAEGEWVGHAFRRG